jgi:hypothetical protein
MRIVGWVAVALSPSFLGRMECFQASVVCSALNTTRRLKDGVHALLVTPQASKAVLLPRAHFRHGCNVLGPWPVNLVPSVRNVGDTEGGASTQVEAPCTTADEFR